MPKVAPPLIDEQQSSVARIAFLEKQLAEQQYLFEQLVEEVKNGYWQWQIPTDQWYYSPGFLQYLGYNAADLATDGTAWQQLIPASDLPFFYENNQALKQGKKSSFSYPLSLQNARGALISLRCKGKVIEWDSKKNPTRVVGVVEKIEDQEQQYPWSKRKEWLQAAAENIPGVAIVLFDHDFRYSLYEGSSKKTRENVIVSEGKTLYEVASPEEVAVLEPLYRDVLQGKFIEQEITYKGGTHYVQFIPLYDEKNQVTHGLIFSIDLSHPRNIGNQLSIFIEQAPIAMAIFDTRMRYIAASQHWVEDYEIEGKDIIGVSHYELFPDTGQEWKDIHQSCLEGEVMRREEDRYLREDGTEEWIRWEVRPWYQRNRQVGGLMVMTEDITQRKLSELALKRHQQGLKILTAISSNHQLSLAEQLQEMLISVADYFDLPVGIISQVNGKVYTVEYAINRDDELPMESGMQFEFAQTYCIIAYEQDDTVAFNSASDSCYASHACYEQLNVETYIGSPIWVAGEKYGTLNFSSPEKRLMAFTGEDIDFMRLVARWVGATLERYANEKQLVAARQEAEEATQAKTDFLSTMSHEIRTPMNAVIGMAHLLLEESPRPDQIKSLQTLKFSADLLLSLINDILDFNKIEAGKITLESVDFNLKDLLQGIKSAQGFKAQEKQVRMKLRWDDDVPEMVVGDPVRLGQIINNLANNAVKFTNEGQVSIEVELREETADHVSLRFEVKDTGVGIPEDKLAAIFDEFSQASSSTTRQFGGTGLGLAITKKLLELQGSQIQVSSQLGVGSSFFFTLSLGKSTKEVVSNGNIKVDNSGEYMGSLRGAHILLVEDNPINQHVATRFIKKWQATLDTANHGGEALEKIQQWDYDLVLMDLQMPVVDGYEATINIRAWQEENNKPRIPIIALTASATHSVRDQVIAVGMNDFVSKPFVPKELFARLQQYLSSAETKPIEAGSVAEEELPEMTSAEGKALFNAEFFKKLADGKPEDLEHLYDKYEEMTEQFKADLLGFLENPDEDLLRRNIHRVKATFQLTGAQTLSQLLQEITEAEGEVRIRLVKQTIKTCSGLKVALQNYRQTRDEE